MTKEQAESVSHAGDCREDLNTLFKLPEIKKQLDIVDPELLKNELQEYEAWDDLSNHERNLKRLLWIAGSEIHQHSDEV